MERLLAGRYRLGDDLGAGGTARVVRAIDELLGRTVAVKLLDTRIAASADPTGRERFLQECRTLAGFSHPAAVTVFDAGEDDGDLFLVMELVEGSSLAEHLASSGPLSVAEATRIAGEIAGVLAAAHATGVVHRDVKPANILLGEAGTGGADTGSGGIVKLADFGIAKRFEDLEESVTSTGFVVGTPRYLAPEQATGQAVSPATDVYALGAVLFEMLTGQPPFVGDSAVAIAVAQQSTPAPDIRTLRPDVPAAMAAAIAQAIEVDPTRRPASAAQFGDALTAAAGAAAVGGVDAGGGSHTLLMPDGRAAGGADVETRVLPAEVAQSLAPRSRSGAHQRQTRRVVLAVLAVALTVGLAYALSARSGVDLASSGAELGTLADAVSSESSGPSSVPSTVASTVAPIATEPVLLEPVPTEPAAPAVAEIIPGFAATDDLSVFLEQVERDPALVGSKGGELAETLRKVVDERGRKQGDLAAELRAALNDWAESGELDPAVAVELDRLLDPLASRANANDNDDDD
ncbi:MAG TPA: serine/threonine-protein kinase [Ilumatobacter sp.]|nr:serine/threonine-protein kinase [Ilumatobacter sp.]